MLSTYITAKNIKINMESTDRDECFAELVEVLVNNQSSINRAEALQVLITREEKMSTAIYPKVAVPHAISGTAAETTIAIGVSKNGIEFEPVDSKSKEYPVVNIIFEILFEKNDTEGHLHILRDVVHLISDPEFYEGVMKAQSAQEVYDLIVACES